MIVGIVERKDIFRGIAQPRVAILVEEATVAVAVTVAGVEDLLVAVDVDRAEETKVQLRRRLLGTKSHLQRESPMKS
jgi:hypothetical protein